MEFDWQKILNSTVDSVLASAFPASSPKSNEVAPIQVLPAPQSASGFDMKSIALWGVAGLAVVVGLVFALRK